MDKFEQPIMVTKSFLPPIERYIERMGKIWEKSWLTNNGEFHAEFENKVRKYLEVGNASLLVNGHLALEIAIESLGLKGEIITTPFTFASTTHAIVNCGLTPVFCDIERRTFNIDPDKIEDLITSKTSAIIPVHVFGNPCNIEKIESIAKRHNLKVIYDAAHAFGVKINEIGIGNFGDISMFSLHATKVFHSIEGGILTCNKESLKRKVELLKNFGISGPETIELVGTNAKMNEFQAIMGILNLEYIEENIRKRKVITQKYRELLRNIDGIYYVDDIENVKHNYSYFPVIVEEEYGLSRDELHDKLKDYNIFTRKYFYPLTIDFEFYKNDFRFKKPDLRIAKSIAEKVITLPIYSDLKLEDVEIICDKIANLKVNI
ncbi:DegT/DnrJ/EryC1/StrS family aminotransferase [Aneurinibacillus migulanus]|uniref:DegT/DnrJ/EryC1/StrS family aminotransferase n=1 Tax=Aneurinibacillus migulanus TaxID=47500 RepID=UPI002E20D64D|nr:DegT/DnrJ/EryC1/StrS family aminotransferase [Aneurinibacillus migulanus]